MTIPWEEYMQTVQEKGHHQDLLVLQLIVVNHSLLLLEWDSDEIEEINVYDVHQHWDDVAGGDLVVVVVVVF